MPQLKPIKIFISYAHEDAPYLSQIKKLINSYALQNITIWDDGEITAGSSWDETIKRHLDEADIILLLLSVDFFDSAYIHKVELRTAFEKHRLNKCRIIPIYIRDCVIRDEEIKALEGLPKGVVFIANCPEIERDRYYTQVELGITRAITEMRIDANIVEVSEEEGNVNKNKALELKAHDLCEKKVLLSQTESELGNTMRDIFMDEADREIEYKKWDFRINDFNYQSDNVIADIVSATFIVHIFTSEDEINSGLAKRQFDLAIAQDKDSRHKKQIIWLSLPSLLDKLPLSMKSNKVIIGLKRSEIIECIKTLEQDRQKQISEERQEFAPQANVYLLYNWDKDHTNNERIRLKEKLEKRRDIIPDYPSSNPAPDGIEIQLKNSKGVIIFYGMSDAKWYCYWQAEVQKIQSLRRKGAFVGAPGKDEKLLTDVNRRAFLVVDNENDVDNYLNNFITGLK